MKSRQWWGTLGLLGCIALFIPLFIPAFQNVFNADESLLFFVGSHPIWQRSFWESTGSMVAGMPWYFVEFWFYIRAMGAVLGDVRLNEHLETWARLPMIYHYALGGISAFWCVKNLTRSASLGLIIAVPLFLMGPLALSNVGEFRIHASGLSYHMLSWAAFSYFLVNPKKGSVIWLLFAGLAPWAHIFSVYGVVLQISVAVWIYVFKGRRLSISLDPELYAKRTLRTVGLLCINMAIAVYFFLRYMQWRVGEPVGEPWTGRFNEGFTYFFSNILYPHGFFWVAGLAVALAWGQRNKSHPDSILKNRELSLIFFALQLVAGGVLCARVLSANYRPDAMPRYVTASLPPLVFFLGLCLTNIDFKKLFSERLQSLISATVVLVAWIAMGLFAIPKYGSIEDKKHPFFEIRAQILKLDAAKSIQFVSGVTPRNDHSLITHIGGGWWGHTWQVYTKGPLQVASIREYKTSRFGGLRGVDCQEAQKWEVFGSGSTARFGLLIDLCNIDQFYLRVAPSASAGEM